MTSPDVQKALDSLVQQLAPRELLYDDEPNGYLVSDRDWFEANRHPVVDLMEAIIKSRA